MKYIKDNKYIISYTMALFIDISIIYFVQIG